MSGLGLGLGLGLGGHRKVGGEPYSDVLALEYDLTQITAPTTIALAIKAGSGWFDAGQEASIDWGDGTTPIVVSATSPQSGYISHEYTTAGTYMVKVSGTMKAYRRAGFDNLAGQDLLTHIRSFGKLGIESFECAFYNCTGLISVPKYCPKNISNMAFMFRDCLGAAFNPDVSAWDVSNVTTMYNMFRYCSGAAFNPDVSNWDVSNVRNMAQMFFGCSGASFNPDVSNWDVSNVTTMERMFLGCSGASFNPDVSNWDVSNVTTMERMFYTCLGAAFRGGRGTAGTGIANWTPDSLTVAAGLMESTKKQEDGFLDPILMAWADLIDDIEHPLPENITIDFGTNTYTIDAAAAISALENHGWVISSGGLVE
jgi:surface protein